MKHLLDQIEELYFLGGNLNEILRETKAIGLPKEKKAHKVWTTMEIRTAKEMREEGYTYREIAQELGRKPKQISQRLYRIRDREAI